MFNTTYDHDQQLVPFEKCNPLVGFSLLGEANRSFKYVAEILLGQYDVALSYTYYYQTYDKKPESESDLEDAEVKRILENTKNYFRQKTQDALDNLEREEMVGRIGENIEKRKRERRERKQEEKRKEAIGQSIRDSYKPSEQGTVAEIAKKLGISKSEVRRRKREGEL